MTAILVFCHWSSVLGILTLEKFELLNISTRQIFLIIGFSVYIVVFQASLVAQTAPPDFVIEDAFPTATFNLPVQVVFLPDGRKLVVEKEGQIWTMASDGTKLTTPFIDVDCWVLLSIPTL